jgi:hypothetical protein
MVYPLEKMSKQDVFFLMNFNFYNKKIDFTQLINNEPKVFHVEKTKTPESTIDNDNPALTRLLNYLEEMRDYNKIILSQFEMGMKACFYIYSLCTHNN